MKIVRVADGAVLHNAAMGIGCTASKWRTVLDKNLAIADKTRLRFSVEYQSGGLFDDIVTTYDFTYHKQLRGD